MEDAEKAIKQAKKGIKYHAVHGHMKEIVGYPGRGKPKKGATKVVKGYQVSYQFTKDEEKIEQTRLKKKFMPQGIPQLSLNWHKNIWTNWKLQKS